MRDFIFLLEAFSIDALNSMNLLRTSDFFFRKKTQVNLEKSLMKVTTYYEPLMDVVGMGPLISKWIILFTTFLSPFKLVLRMFSDNTIFANSTGSFDGWEAFNHGIFMKFLQAF